MTGIEPADGGLRLVHEHGRALRVAYRGRPLLRYVYQPWDPQLESPRPYFHPLHTVGGNLVSLYRPHDHVWHRGIAFSLPNVGEANFWGGVTYTRGRGYEQLPNDGAMVHRGFDRVESTADRVTVAERLDWITEPGERWFTEERLFTVTAEPGAGAWTLVFGTAFTNVSERDIVIGSPTTQGRENAGYGGLFWRGPRSFSGGTVYAPGVTGGDELMGVRAPWLGFAGRHDGAGAASTLVFVDAPENAGHPVKWFVRTGSYACLCPAPFFDTELTAQPGDTIALRYAVTIADGDAGLDGTERLAKAGLATLLAAA